MIFYEADDSLRLYIGYRELNKRTIKNKYPLPCIDDLFEQLSGTKVFSQLDRAKGFHWLRVAEDNVPLTTFRIPIRFYEWLVMSFVLTNTPAYFVDLINKVFQKMLNKFQYKKNMILRRHKFAANPLFYAI